MTGLATGRLRLFHRRGVDLHVRVDVGGAAAEDVILEDEEQLGEQGDHEDHADEHARTPAAAAVIGDDHFPFTFGHLNSPHP